MDISPLRQQAKEAQDLIYMMDYCPFLYEHLPSEQFLAMRNKALETLCIDRESMQLEIEGLKHDVKWQKEHRVDRAAAFAMTAYAFMFGALLVYIFVGLS